MIFEQIQALRDAGTFGFCAWNARNAYTISDYRPPFPEANANPPLRAALLADLEKRHQARASAPAASSGPKSRMRQERSLSAQPFGLCKRLGVLLLVTRVTSKGSKDREVAGKSFRIGTSSMSFARKEGAVQSPFSILPQGRDGLHPGGAQGGQKPSGRRDS
jgi:hypothetical protein